MTLTNLTEALFQVCDSDVFDDNDRKEIKRKWKRLLDLELNLRAEQLGRKRVVVKLGNGHWLCSSDSRPGDFHSVEYVGGSDYHCSCEDAQLNKNESCHHVDQIREVEQHV